MGRRFEVFLAEALELAPILTGLGWAVANYQLGDFPKVDHFRLEERDWLADIWGPSPMGGDDAPPEASDLLAGIAWHVEISLEGSEKGLSKLARAATAIAKAGRGVIADENEVWKPGSRSRSRWSVPPPPLSRESEILTLIWWTLSNSTSTPQGARALVETLQRLLPEAMPIRWGDFEPLPLSLEKEGLDGLAEYIERQSHDVLFTKVKPPFAQFSLHGASLLHDQRSGRARSLLIEVGASILDQPGWGRQMVIAFRAISALLQPFYAEARTRKTARPDWPRDLTPGYVPPISDQRWCGFPHVPPMAMVVGPPYTALWRDPGGSKLDDLILYSSESWPQPAPGGVPVAPEPLLQEFDPRSLPTPTRLSSIHPSARPPVWPFG